MRSAFCGVTELAFWRDVLKLALASKLDPKERAVQDELIRHKPGLLAGDVGTSRHDRGAEVIPSPHCRTHAYYASRGERSYQIATGATLLLLYCP